jgi:hypothetical protein
MGQYRIRLYGLDPRNSELINDLDGVMRVGQYITITAAVVLTLLFYQFRGSVQLTNFFIFTMVVWIATLLHLSANQITLHQLIVRTKWKTLNRIQTQIQDLHASEQILSEENISHLEKLMGYHDRIRSTRDTALNLSDLLTALNTLIVPLIGFVLSNYDTIRKFFPW